MGMVLLLVIYVTKFALLVTGANTFSPCQHWCLFFSLWYTRARTQKHEHESGVTRCKASDVVYFCGFQRHATYKQPLSLSQQLSDIRSSTINHCIASSRESNYLTPSSLSVSQYQSFLIARYPFLFSSPDTRPLFIQPDPTCTARRHRHSISGQMSYFKLLGYNVSKKLTGSANSLFSTAVISGSSSAPNLKDMVPPHASAVAGKYHLSFDLGQLYIYVSR